MKHERLWTMRNKLSASEGWWVGEWYRELMGSKDGMYSMVQWVLYTTNESLKERILNISATWTTLEEIMLSEISQAEKDSYHLISLIYGT